jgi:hypothetical protein
MNVPWLFGFAEINESKAFSGLVATKTATNGGAQLTFGTQERACSQLRDTREDASPRLHSKRPRS